MSQKKNEILDEFRQEFVKSIIAILKGSVYIVLGVILFMLFILLIGG